MAGWRLEDVVVRQRESPRSYPIPRAAERSGLIVGDLVKLVFLLETPGEVEGERMWVEVDQVVDGGFVGRLANEPQFVPLKLDDEVRFEPRHVASVVFPPIEDDAMVIVSRLVLDEDAWPRRLIREPASQQYCGWQVFAGDEPAGWAQDPKNARLVRVAQLLDQFPVLESVFGDWTPGEWLWSADALEYSRTDEKL